METTKNPHVINVRKMFIKCQKCFRSIIYYLLRRLMMVSRKRFAMLGPNPLLYHSTIDINHIILGNRYWC